MNKYFLGVQKTIKKKGKGGSTTPSPVNTPRYIVLYYTHNIETVFYFLSYTYIYLLHSIQTNSAYICNMVMQPYTIPPI